MIMEASSNLPFVLTSTFFGFSTSDRITLHENIFNLIWWGEGRWSWDDVYYMPVHIRQYWIKRVNSIVHEKYNID
jgi:hypothetical protein